MRFSKIYQAGGEFPVSVEVFPPKTPEGIESLLTELQKLRVIHPRYVSVTYGAMGSTQELTRDLALRIHDDLGFHVAYHFTCIGMTPSSIKAYTDSLLENGLNLIVALRGDKPTPEYQTPEGGFAYANELVTYLKSLHNFSIAVAGYPEKHMDAPSMDVDIDNLKRKVDAGAGIIITQLFFDNHKFTDWVNRVRQKGITIPIVAGIMPIQNSRQILRISQMSGASLPLALQQQLQQAGDDDQRVKDLGVEFAIQQCRDIKAQGLASGIHFYCLNKAESVVRVAQEI